MSTLAIDTYRLLTALKGTGKSANFTAEEIAGAVHVAQEGAELLTKADFGVRMDGFGVRIEARMESFEARMESFEARMESFEARMDSFEARILSFEARMDALAKRIDDLEAKFEAKLEAVRADIKAEVKAGQVQNLMWLSGIVLASNGMVIALLARLAHVI